MFTLPVRWIKSLLLRTSENAILCPFNQWNRSIICTLPGWNWSLKRVPNSFYVLWFISYTQTQPLECRKIICQILTECSFTGRRNLKNPRNCFWMWQAINLQEDHHFTIFSNYFDIIRIPTFLCIEWCIIKLDSVNSSIFREITSNLELKMLAVKLSNSNIK